jgi:hypothetical protein
MAGQRFLAGTYRAEIRARLNELFPDLVVIYGSRPSRFLRKSQLPRAFIRLRRNRRGLSDDMNATAVRDISDAYTFEIAIQEQAPVDQPIEERKDELSDAIIERFTREPRFLSAFYRNFDEVDFREDDDDPVSRIHEVMLVFTVSQTQHYRP